MPLPLIPVLLGGAALASAAFGLKKGYDAYCQWLDCWGLFL
ncbi:hypothetical protein [Helicobacter ibis]|uniref:Uncharacterized protein n=1 Tax=Helicobacter ibis TaxID=2962633 RepID=A0ABT4VFX6_9HELI|nr:hypothetical protein [Helicobacter ibis]MDA3969604.1 hypothetical protein [Helicobacter ibis]